MILLLSPSDISDLVSIGCLQQCEKPSTTLNGSSYANLNRASMWMSTRDIGFISAWRKKDENGKEYTWKQKEDRNKNLVKALRELGYGVTKARGLYPEGGTELKSENSFLVVNLLDSREEFIHNLCQLSEEFNQDTILIKYSDSDTAFFYATNDYTRNSPDYPEGKKEAGKLHFGISDDNGYSTIGSGKFCFKND